MPKEFDVREYAPLINRAEFGNSEHIAIVRTPAKSLFFEVENGSKKGVFAIGWGTTMYQDRNYPEGKERCFFNGHALLKLVNELGLVNISIQIACHSPNEFSSLNGYLRGGLSRSDGLLTFTLGIVWRTDEIYKRFNEEEALSLSINHVFLHESYHVHEKLYELPSDYDRILNSEVPPVSKRPAEIFARKKMKRILAGRNDLQPLIII